MSAEAGDNYDGFRLVEGSDGSTIRGLSITGFTDGGSYGEAIVIRSDNNIIAGNYIGLTPDGTTPAGNKTGVLLINGAENNVIGGADSADKNIISASSYAGVDIRNSGTSNNRIVGNDFGLDKNGDTITSGTFGVLVWENASDNSIGGINGGEGNRITGHREGVVIDDLGGTAINNAILGNEIYDNREMAIDLGNDGITDNDVDDIDSGPNDELNFPVITNVNQNGSDLELSFNLEVPPGQYRVEFFENPNGIDGTGLGEGQSFLGAVTITSSGSGSEIFNEVLTGVTASNLATVAATTTEFFGGTSYGSTSEFGPATTAQTILNPIKDTYLYDDEQDRNYGDSSILLLDQAGGGLGHGRVLLQFDLSSIPAGAEITGAVLQLNATSNTGEFSINVYEVTEDWEEGTGGTGAADWDYRYTPENSSSRWSSAGGTVDDSTIIASLETPDTGLHSWDVTTLVQDWFTGAAVNNGLMLASPDTGTETVEYDSRESANAPQLILTYSLPANTAPTLDDTLSPELESILEDNGPPSGAVGTRISDLVDLQGGGGLDNITDPDPGAVAGIAVTAADAANGSWYYSTDDGTSWSALGSVGDDTARLLAADSLTRIYFEANPGFSGTIATAITFRAWDQTSGLNGDLGDTTFPGGSSAFSLSQDTAALTVSTINPIYQAVSPIVIDGTIDGNWSMAASYSIDQLIGGSVADAADLSGTFRVIWDDTYLYTLIEVNDDAIINDSGPLIPWMDDGIEIFLDPDYSHGNSYDGINDYAFGIRVADERLFTLPTSLNDTTGFLHSSVIGAGSYVVEVAVPWTTLGVIPVAGAFVGFDVQLNDDDDGLLRDGKLSWNDPLDNAYFNPSFMGTMQLIGNSLPTIGGIDSGTVTEDVDVDAGDLIHVSETLTISDPDPGQSTFRAETLSGTYGDLTIDSAGNWAYSSDNTQAAIQQLSSSEFLTDTLTVTAADGTTHDIVITIDGTDDPSVIGGVLSGTVSEDISLTASDALTITDVDNLDNPSFDDVSPSLGGNGFGDFEMTGNTWTYTLNNSLVAVQALGAGETLTDTYTFLASDGSSQEVTITIDGTDDPSVIGGVFAGTVSEDTTLTTSNTLTITDVDTPDTPSFNDVLVPAAGDNGYGSFTISGNTWTYTLNNGLAAVQALGAGETLTDTYTFFASDGSTQEVTITIDGTDDPSVIGGFANGSVSEDTSLTASNTLTITDVDTPDSPSFTDVAPSLGNNGFGDFEITGNTWTYTLNNSLAAVQALGAGQTLTDTYTFLASDGSNAGGNDHD